MYRRNLLTSIAVSALCVTTLTPDAVAAQERLNYNIPAQDLGTALRKFAKTSKLQVIFDGDTARGKRSTPITNHNSPDAALRELLNGTGLTYQRNGKIYIISPAQTSSLTSPYLPSTLASAAAVQAPAPQYDEIIVTAQRKEERITDVPIAMTALSSQALDDKKIEGGSELLRAVPNVSFTKTNFSMYNFSIRGIGTQSISASSDPAVAVSFNSTPLVRNRLFEAEFFDVQRVEVLRGPQGTLYGRNATAGVVNMIPAPPEADFEANVKAEIGNYNTKRVGGMINVPLSDTLAVRAAGTLTKRDGFEFNRFFQTKINGRDLWSTRGTIQWEPNPNFKASLIWQHFKEDDNRSRSSKQLCTTDNGPEKIGNVLITNQATRARIGQGCLPGSLYSDDAFGTPNSAALVYLYFPSIQMRVGQIGSNGRSVYGVLPDSLDGVRQSKNLRIIDSNYDPIFKAKNDVLQLNLDFNLGEKLTIISQTAYSKDMYFSSQDYNRFVTKPLFSDSNAEGLYVGTRPINRDLYPGPSPLGIFTDPQLGQSNRMISADLSHSRNRQWSQEVRLQSDFDSSFNFLLGLNMMDFRSQDNYYVFNNMFTYIANWQYSLANNVGSSGVQGYALLPCELGNENRECVYVDPNPIGRLNNQGHNYFLSQNGVHIKSKAIFGEIYKDFSDELKLTIGLRYTKDEKLADQVPSQLLLGGGRNSPLVLAAGGPDTPLGARRVGDLTGGRNNFGYPKQDDIFLEWGKLTGRAVVDWRPNFDITDDSLFYASVSRGYKGGGVNPPRIDFNPAVVQFQYLPQTFRPEYVNAFEIGTKHIFGNGKYSINATAFFYDYKDFQVSQITDRIAYNENFDATSFGLELEGRFAVSRNFLIDGNLGLLKTRIGKGAQSIDVMNRTQGDPDWVVLRPWLQVPSNCIAPKALVERIISYANDLFPLAALCPGADRAGSWAPSRPGGTIALNFWDTRFHPYGFTYDFFAPYDPAKVGAIVPYDPTNPDSWIGGTSGAPNGGRGFYANLEGNELPNAPRLTANIGAQYTQEFANANWEFSIRSDYYFQSKSYGRVYNTAFDRLRSWDNLNLSLNLKHIRSDLSLNIYVKNVINKTPITGYFVNSDDNGLTTNVFTPDPRIFGLRFTKSI